MIVANIVGLNTLWFVSVLGAANGMVWPAVIVLLLLLGFNLVYQNLTYLDGKIILISIVAGLIIDGVTKHLGLVIYAYDQPSLGLAPPLWIMLLWVGFGATIRIGMQWLLSRPILGGLIMLIGAPLSYVSAGKLGAASIPDLWQALTFIGVCWLLYFSVIVQINNQQEAKNVLV